VRVGIGEEEECEMGMGHRLSENAAVWEGGNL
jgi:hypothetical protein